MPDSSAAKPPPPPPIDAPPVLVIAGSDSGGGAGVQADIKTITALGGFAMTALSAVTAQNTQGVQDVFPVPPAFLRRQIQSVLDDMGAAAIKTGMLPTQGAIETVADALSAYEDTLAGGALVVDPVMVASSGDRLIHNDAVEALRACLLPRASVITPNMPEAAILTGRDVETLDDMKWAGDALMQKGAQAVLIKGGHSTKKNREQTQDVSITDILATPDGFIAFEHPRQNSLNVHGTGCTLASALAVKLAQGLALADATSAAIQFVQGAIKHANPNLGKGQNKPLNHGWERGR